MKHLFLRLFSTNSEERLEILPGVWSCRRPLRIGRSKVDWLHTPVIARYMHHFYISVGLNDTNLIISKLVKEPIRARLQWARIRV